MKGGFCIFSAERAEAASGQTRRKGSTGSTSNDRSSGGTGAPPCSREAAAVEVGACGSAAEPVSCAGGPRLQMFQFLNRSARKTIDIRRSCSFESISDHKYVTEPTTVYHMSAALVEKV